MATNMVADCARRGLALRVFSDLKPNPTGDNIHAGIAAFQHGEHGTDYRCANHRWHRPRSGRGALYDAHHGLLNAILMLYVLLANRAAIEARIARLAHCLELTATVDDFLR